MVSPEGSRSRNGRPGPRRAPLFAAAAAIVTIGFVVLGDISTTDQVALDETTTTSTTLDEVLPPIDPDNFSVSQIATGEPLDWTHSAGLDDGAPIALIEHNGTIYLFTTDPSGLPFSGGGLTAWRSDNGLDWTSLGQVIDENHLVTEVISTLHGFVAVGRQGQNTGLTVWRSKNAADWTASELAAETDSPYLFHYPTAVGSTSDAVVVASRKELDITALVEDRLREASVEVDLEGLNWQTYWAGGKGHILTLVGPLGLEVQEIPFETLNLRPEEADWLANGFYPDPVAHLWLQRQDSDWRQSEIEGAMRIDWLAGLPAGDFVAIGQGVAGPVIRQSTTGRTWVPIHPDSAPHLIQQWGDALIGVDNRERPNLVISQGDMGWLSLGLAAYFPEPFSWTATALGAGSDGVAATVQSWDGSLDVRHLESPQVIINDDSTLTLDFEDRALVLERGDSTYSWDFYPDASLADSGIEVDRVEGVVTLLDPESREPLEELGFAELQLAEIVYSTRELASRTHRAFVFTPDGSDWTIQDLTNIIRNDASIAMLEVAAGRVIAVVENPSVWPSLEVWTAEIP